MAEINPNTRPSSTRFVHVGCKLSNGLKLELFHENTIARETGNGMFNPAAFKPPVAKATFVLRGGNAVRNDFSLRGLAQPRFEYSVTPIPEDFWREWYEQHKDDAYCRGGFVFALPKEKEVIAEGKIRASEPTGTEPLNEKVELDARVNKDAIIRQQHVTADPGHLALLRERNNRL